MPPKEAHAVLRGLLAAMRAGDSKLILAVRFPGDQLERAWEGSQDPRAMEDLVYQIVGTYDEENEYSEVWESLLQIDRAFKHVGKQRLAEIKAENIRAIVPWFGLRYVVEEWDGKWDDTWDGDAKDDAG